MVEKERDNVAFGREEDGTHGTHLSIEMRRKRRSPMLASSYSPRFSSWMNDTSLFLSGPGSAWGLSKCPFSATRVLFV